MIKHCLWPALFTIVWVLLGLEALDYMWGGLWFGVLLMLIVFRLVQVLVATMVRRFDVVPSALAWIAAVVVTFLLHMFVVEWQLKISQDRGDEIAEALENYFEQYRAYPLALDDLVPDMITGLPRPATGLWQARSFHYSTSMDDYLLEFAAPGFLFCRRDPTSEWSFD